MAGVVTIIVILVIAALIAAARSIKVVQQYEKGIIFRFVVWHSIALGAIVGLIVMFYAYVAPHLVPHGVKLMSQ